MPETEKIREEMCRLNLINAAKTLHCCTITRERKPRFMAGLQQTNKSEHSPQQQNKKKSFPEIQTLSKTSDQNTPRYLLIETPKRNMESTCGMALNKKSI